MEASISDDRVSRPNSLWQSPEKARRKPSCAATEELPSRCSTPWASPEKRNRTRRFHPEELTCFRRLPTPSPLCAQKAESYWQLQGGLRRVLSDSGLHILPLTKGDFWHADNEELGETDADTTSHLGATHLPMEEQTAMVLDQIFPRSSLADALNRDCSRKHRTVMEPCSSVKVDIPTTNTRQGKFMHLRQKILQKFNTVKDAFESFLQLSGDYNRELSFKEFARFLRKHFTGLSQKEQESIFEFLDADNSGGVSLSEFHIAVEASAHVSNMDDLRKRWIALGFSSMRQALSIMENSLEKSSSAKRSSQRLGFAEFAAALSRVGINTDEEHHSLFAALTKITGCSTVSLAEFTSAVTSVSPSLLLEDLRDRLLKAYGSLHTAFKALHSDKDSDLTYEDFVQRAINEFKMSRHEAAKAFELIDIDRNHSISLVEFVTALRLSEPGLFLEEVRRKVRQRFRSIREAFALEESEVHDFVQNHDSHEKHHFRPFRRASMFFKDTEAMTLSEIHSVLSSLQLTESETKLLFQMVDINGDGKLTSVEFVRAIRLFAPSCILEELRTRCHTQLDCVRDILFHAPLMSAKADRSRSPTKAERSPKAEKSPKSRASEILYDKRRLRKLLENLDLADGIDVEAIFDLVECRHDGGLHINELIVALESSAAGMQVPLPPELRDARARQQVRWHMAPFHRSVSELRHEVRQKPGELIDEFGRNVGSSPDKSYYKSSPSGAEKSLPTLANISPQKSASSPSLLAHSQTSLRNDLGDSPLNSGLMAAADLRSRSHAKSSRPSFVAHPPTKRSYKKISQYLESMPSNHPLELDGHAEAVLERITEYYQNAGDIMAHDWQLLKSPQHRLAPFDKPRPFTRS